MLGPTIGCLTAIARASLASLTAPSARKKSCEARVQLEQEKIVGSEIILWIEIFVPIELPHKGERRRSVRRTAQHGSARAEGRQERGMGVESIGI